MQNPSLIKKVQDYVWPFPSSNKRRKSSSVRKVSRPVNDLPREKQRQIELLCKKLFERRELAISGRLQLLGLAKVKQRMGPRRWAGLQNVIYAICEETIRKYLDRKDLYLRYRDESYMLLFATASAMEGELKVALIAEEIKRRLFEEEGVDDVEITSQSTPIRSHRAVNQNEPFPESLNIAFEESLAEHVPPCKPDRCAVYPDISCVRRTEIEAFPRAAKNSASLDLGIQAEEILFQAVHYIPVWDHFKTRLVAHLCLARNDDDDHPIEAHRTCYAGGKANLDLAVLARIIGWMQENPDRLKDFGIICPVHYPTLLGVESKERYRAMCQKIDERMKQFLLFMVLDLPPSTPWISLSHLVSPLKTYGRVLCGHLPSHGHVDFEALRLAGFDNAGIILSPSMRGSRADINSFVARARKHLITQTFVLGINDPQTAAEAAAAGVRYLGGHAVHRPISDPGLEPDFDRYPFARVWSKTGGNT